MNLFNLVSSSCLRLAQNAKIIFLCSYYPRITAIFSAILVFIVSLCGGHLYLSELRNDIRVAQQTLTKWQDKVATIALPSDMQTSTNLNALFAYAQQQDSMWDRVYALAAKHNIKFVRSNLLETEPLIGLKRQQVQVDLQGDYNDLGNFLSDIANMQPIAFVTWHNLMLIPSTYEDLLDISMLWKIYTAP